MSNDPQLVGIDTYSLPRLSLPVISIGKSDIGRIIEGEILATEDGAWITTEDNLPICF